MDHPKELARKPYDLKNTSFRVKYKSFFDLNKGLFSILLFLEELRNI